MISLKPILKLPAYLVFVAAVSLIKNLIETDRITPSDIDLISLDEEFNRFQEIDPEEDEFTRYAAEIQGKKKIGNNFSELESESVFFIDSIQ